MHRDLNRGNIMLTPPGAKLLDLYADGTAEEKPITHVTFLLTFLEDLRRKVPPAEIKGSTPARKKMSENPTSSRCIESAQHNVPLIPGVAESADAPDSRTKSNELETKHLAEHKAS